MKRILAPYISKPVKSTRKDPKAVLSPYRPKPMKPKSGK